jgi:hypothetical protein
MPRFRAFSLFRPFGLLAAVLLALLAGFGPAAQANDTPGNNGTVKIHEGNTENDPGEVRNEPHVCTFHLHFYFADPEQAGTWEIQEWAPTGVKGTVVLSGTYDTHGDGEDREPDQGVYTLPDGHYKLFWDGDLDTGKHDKMKVFWVDCPEATPTPSPTGSEAPIGGSQPPSAPASASPTGSELPAEGSGSIPPTGGVGGVVGTPPPVGGVGDVNATPPPTDAAGELRPAGGDGWRIVLIALAALITAAVFLLPAPAPMATRTTRRRRDR